MLLLIRELFLEGRFRQRMFLRDEITFGYIAYGAILCGQGVFLLFI